MKTEAEVFCDLTSISINAQNHNVSQFPSDCINIYHAIYVAFVSFREVLKKQT